MTTPTTTPVLTPAGLRARRLELGISAVRVADALGVRLTEVGRWERGEVLPDPMRWRLLAGMLHLDEAALWVAPRRPEPDEVDVVIDLLGADPFVSLVDRSGAALPQQRRRPAARPRWRRTRLIAALVLLGLGLAWAAGNLGGAVADLVGAFAGR